MPPDLDKTDFDGCARPCRTSGVHTDVWGVCVFAVEPEPVITIGGKAFVAADGELSVGFGTFTLSQLAERVERVIRSVPVKLGPNSLTVLNHGGTVGLSAGEYSAMALEVAYDLFEGSAGATLGERLVGPATRVRHLIEITTTTTGYDQHPVVTAFEFESRDIGYTQGTTIRHGGTVIAQYRPGTRHWDRALEIAEQNLAKAVEKLLTEDGARDVAALAKALAKVLADDNCAPWDGRDPQEDL